MAKIGGGFVDADEQPAPVALTPLRINGQYFEQVDGTPWTVIEASFFRAYEKFLADDGTLVEALAELHTLGFNTVRVWLLNTSVGDIQPKEHPEFYAQLPDFAALCAAYGLYVEFTVFTQTETLMPKLVDQQAHLDAVYGALADTFCFIEGVNEDDQHDNAVHPDLDWSKPAGAKFLTSRGSNGSDSAPPAPHLDYVLYHSNDLDEWQRKVGHNAMEYADIHDRPAMANENTRPDRDGFHEHHFYDASAAAALLTAGACFHSESGKHARVMSDGDKRCAVAWVNGAKSVPLEFQHGRYGRHEDNKPPDVLRVYSRTLSDGRAHFVSVRK